MFPIDPEELNLLKFRYKQAENHFHNKWKRYSHRSGRFLYESYKVFLPGFL